MQDSGIINFHEARDFGGKMNATYFFVRQNIKRLGKSLLFFAAPSVLLGVVLYHEIFTRMISLQRAGGVYGGSPYGLDEYYSSANFYLQLFSAIVFMLLGGVLTVSTTYAFILVYQEKQTTQIDLGDIWRKTRQLFWSNFGTMFLYYLGMILAGAVLFIPFLILSYISSFIYPVLISLSVLAYFVALIALCIYFSLVFFIRCKERIGFFDALGRLFKLTKQKFWSTVVFGLINVYIQIVFATLFVIPWYLYLYLVMLHDISPIAAYKPSFLQESISVLLYMIYALASILLTALPLIAMAMQYFSLVELKEAKGLMARIENFGEIKYVTDVHEDF